ncbi:hypothetical protein [Sphingobacterium faecale]|uniref:Uncharacterized protein n=1 Tax=Sphingobacterium faecale TaxID=2803775 RepID=A0ABS1QY37_9SPHI|nr:hypothetical protein [Sphingobacterium faecale]MBL1407342.1 hypothetical protein [Sphingobacterium faecale]
MKRRTKKIGIVIGITIVLISNIPVFNLGLLARLDDGKLRYSNADGSCTRIEKFNYFSGLIEKEGIEAGIAARTPPPKEGTTEMYRLYRLNPLYFWRWSYYLIVSKDFKYKDWKEIEPNRVPYDPDNIGQQF